MLTWFFVKKTCLKCYKHMHAMIQIVVFSNYFNFFLFFPSLLASSGRKSVSLALERRLGGNVLGSGENFPRIFSDKNFLLSNIDYKFIIYDFDHRITIVPRFGRMQFPTIRKSDGFSTVIATCFSYFWSDRVACMFHWSEWRQCALKCLHIFLLSLVINSLINLNDF